MCYIWKHPTVPDEEVDVATLAKLPAGFDNVNVSGGADARALRLGDALVKSARP
jgi:hypothetical protein